MEENRPPWRKAVPLNIQNEYTHALARELAEVTGQSISEAVTIALLEALDRRRSQRETLVELLVRDLSEIADGAARLPVRDSRSAEEIIGYDRHGLPH
jgi:antitoxin VapB